MARSRAVLSSRSPGPAEAVAVRTVTSKWLAATARVTRPEAIGPTTGLTDRKFWNWTRRRRLALARQRGTNERPMHRPLVVFAVGVVIFLFTLGAWIVFRESDWRFSIADVLVTFERWRITRRSTGVDLEIIVVLVVVLGYPGLRRRYAFRRATRDLRI
jgi:hypothetical protein